MRMLKIVLVAVAVVTLGYLATVFVPHRHESIYYPLGGIPFKIVAYGRNDLQFAKDVATVEGRVSQLQGIFDLYSSESELAMLNLDAAGGTFMPSGDMRQVLRMSSRWYRESAGAFDPSILPLIMLWKNAVDDGAVPNEVEISDTLALVGMDSVENADSGAVHFAKPGMGLDMGGIAKGYIVDDAVEVLKSRGASRGVIEAGGDAYAFGKGEFKFGIRDPSAKSADAIIGSIMIPEGAIVTSGDYERYAEIGGRRYSHIVDPRSGWPVENEIAGVTIVGGSAADADALATAVMVLGLDAGKKLIGRLPEYRAVIVARSGGGYAVYASGDVIPKLALKDNWKIGIQAF